MGSNITPTIDWISALEPIHNRRRSTLSEDIYASLMKTIMEGNLGPGEHLVEQQLADQFKVSRVAVRDALRRLANGGVVEIIPNRGVFTIELNRTDIDEIFSLRANLEGMAVRIISQRRRRSDFAILLEVVDAMKEVEMSKDRLAITSMDTRFHRQLVDLSGHSRLIQVWHNLAAQIAMVIYRSSTYYSDAGNLAKRHTNLIRVMERGNVETAITEICAHIQGGKENLLLDFSLTGDSNENYPS